MGSTRSVVRENYAFITPDTFVPGYVPEWKDAVCYTHISPVLGARFIQRTVVLGESGAADYSKSQIERLIYVHDGSIRVSCDKLDVELSPDEYAFVPAQSESRIERISGSPRLTLFEKAYVPLAGHELPEPLSGILADIVSQPFLGDPDARLQLLLPDIPAWDMAVNVFTFQSGARLPMVEIHVMEHGLLMLQGEGIYRLGADWHPIQAGDIIWMGSFCPQWFAAFGKKPAAYLYYKDVNRSELT